MVIALNGRTPRKRVAMEFLRLASAGQVREAFRAFVSSSCRHHNPFFHGDPHSLMAAMEENAARFPKKLFEPLRIVEEGDLVVVHGRVRLQPEEAWIALVHIFRFEGRSIVEWWDVSQAPPKDSPNEHGMF